MRNKYDYYTVYVPPDVTDSTDRVLIALTDAEDKPRLYCTPCKWDVTRDNGQEVTVRRTRLVNEPTYTEQPVMFDHDEPFAFAFKDWLK